MTARMRPVSPVPRQRLYSTKAAAQYVGVSCDSMRSYPDEGLIPARRLKQRRVFTLEDLDAFIDGLPEYRTYE